MGLKVILRCGKVHCGVDCDVLTAGGISPRKAAARTGGAQERVANKSVCFHKCHIYSLAA